LIEAVEITKSYGNFRALRGISFKAKEGTVVGFLGPNGAGKTTAMNILSGCLAPDSGSVNVCGFDMAKNSDKAKAKIGYLPENPPIYDEMTVSEYLEFAAGLKKADKNDARRVMELTQTTDIAGRLLSHLSRGTRQRVAIAGALTGNPGVLLLDEPTNGLDPGQIVMIRKIIRELKEQGMTVIVSSHILGQLSEISDEYIVINRGMLIAAGTDEFFKKKVFGAGNLYIDIPADEETCEQVLGGLTGICTYKRAGKSETGACRYALTQIKGNAQKAVFEALSAKGLYLERMAPATKTLEEVYLEMISASDAAIERSISNRRKDENDMA